MSKQRKDDDQDIKRDGEVSAERTLLVTAWYNALEPDFFFFFIVACKPFLVSTVLSSPPSASHHTFDQQGNTSHLDSTPLHSSALHSSSSH